MAKLQDVIDFARFLNKFQHVIRKIGVAGRGHKENDVEHSYQLAMMAWYLNSSNNLGLDTDKLLRYSLVHDIVEVYAGDVFFYGDARDGKEAREAEALGKIEQEFPLGQELWQTIHDYEAEKDTFAEAKFIYALDKLLPIINIYLEGGSTFREFDVSLETLFENKHSKIQRSEEVLALFQDMMNELKKHPEYFPQKSSSPKK